MRVFLAGVAMAAVLLLAYYADASRNASGTMSGINGPYVAGTTISSSVVNARLADIETEITDSLDRSGKGGMLAALRVTDGTLAAPAFSWTSETGSGLFRNGASDIRMSVAGALRENWTSTGVAVTGTASVSGASTLTGTVGIGTAAGVPQLTVQGATDASKGTVYVLGVGGHGYLRVDTDTPITKEAGLFLTKGGVDKWEMYVPANSNELRFFDSADRVKITSGGLVVGSAGTAISASNRGTVSWTPGTVTANTCVQNTATVTGAVAGTECAVGSPAIPPLNMTWACAITLNTCTITICNATAVNATGPAGTWSCRAFNP